MAKSHRSRVERLLKEDRRERAIGPNGPTPRFMLPIAREGDPLEMQFGHNVEIGKVLVQFNALTGNMVLTPADARDVAAKLRHYADMAEGRKAM